MDYSSQKIHVVDMEKQMKSAFIDYSMSVIVQRALPDVRDGLKPVHRRILYSMYNGGLTPDKNYSKSAATVGDVLKYFHPHGDASVYDALVRLAQDFSMRYPLVDGQGNFGSLDGDPPAAMRYTEARLAKLSIDMMTDIEKDTVDFVPNYDGRYKEPVALPSRIPNLLVNGSTGIAVGMATNIPPHNLAEVTDAVCYLVDHPDASLDELMQFIQAPDFPTGGVIVGRAGTRAAYATGRGSVRLRAKCEIIEEHGRSRIEVTEIPYMVNKVRLVKGIADLVKDKRIDGISDLADHSDRMGLKIVIDLKKEANPQVVLNQLYSYSQLQENVSVIMLAIVNGQPRILTLKQMLEEYITFQKEVITRRIRFDLKRARKRAHILEGLKIAIDNIDEVVNILRASKSEPEAKVRLGERFGLTDEQAQAIVDMRLGRLTGLERDKIEADLDALYAKIAEYEKILGDERLVEDLLKKELREVAARYADTRKTKIEMADDDIDIEDLIENDENVYMMTRMGYIKRMPVAAYRVQRRGGRGIAGMATRDEDIVTSMFTAHTHDVMLFLTNTGRLFRIKGYKIPSAGRSAKGTNLVNILQLDADEKAVAILPMSGDTQEGYLMFFTRDGVIKRTPLSEFDNIRKSGIRCLGLREGDAVLGAALTDGTKKIIMATAQGRAICFSEEEIRPMGRTASGVMGIELNEGDYVIGAAVVEDDDMILSVSENGYGVRTEAAQYPVQHRNCKGVRSHKVTEKTGLVTALLKVTEDKDLLLITDDGQVMRSAVKEVRVTSRASQGVILMRTGAKLIDVALAGRDEEKPDDDAPVSAEATEEEQEAVMRAMEETGTVFEDEDVPGRVSEEDEE